MGELTIRRNRGFAVPRYQGMGKAEKSAGSRGMRRLERHTKAFSARPRRPSPRQETLLLEKVSQGVPLDQAVEQLTDGEFTSMEDFQAQFTGGTAPGLENFLAPAGQSAWAGRRWRSPPPDTLPPDILRRNRSPETAETVQRAAVGQEPAPQRASALELGTVRGMGYDLSPDAECWTFQHKSHQFSAVRLRPG